MADLSLLQEFIVDTVDNLETMENNLVKLETEPEHRKIINNMLTSIQTIRANLGYAIGDLSPVPLKKKSRKSFPVFHTPLTAGLQPAGQCRRVANPARAMLGNLWPST